MADLTATLGLNTDELKKGMDDAGKTIEKGLSNTRLTPGGAISQGFAGGGAIGAMSSLAGLISGLVSSISTLISLAKMAMDEAVRMRTLSNATGMSTTELQRLQVVANASGVSIESLAHGFAQFNLKTADAKIKGSELNNALYKMGVGMDKVTKGQFTATDGMLELAKAYEAGTDAQTLAYYGNLMFGSSFEQMLPIIKSGADNIKRYGDSIHTADQEALRLWAFFNDDWSAIMTSLKNGFIELGAVAILQVEHLRNAFEDLYNMTAAEGANLLGTETDYLKDYAERTVASIRPGSNKVEEQKKISDAAALLSSDQRENFIKIAQEELAKGGEGKKLNPFGLAPAGGVSSMQSMGGGDLFGAIAFSPLDAIKENTNRTANSLEAMMEMETGMGPSKTDINLQ